MEPSTIFAILDAMTDPRNAGKLTRLDYVNAHNAMQALAEIFKAMEQKPGEVDDESD